MNTESLVANNSKVPECQTFNKDFPDFHRCSSSYLTHDIHPFAARFPPQLPKWGIEVFTNPGDIVLDPFCGSGTALVEARLADRHAWGVDVDPLAVLISKVKATPVDVSLLLDEAKQLEKVVATAFENFKAHNRRAHLRKRVPKLINAGEFSVRPVEFENRDYWYHPKIAMELSLLANVISRNSGGLVSQIAQLALSSTVIAKEKSSVANVADLVHTRPHFRRKEILPETEAIFHNRLRRICTLVSEFSTAVSAKASTIVKRGDARALAQFHDSSVDLVFTSPPYINALDYPRAHKFGLVWLGHRLPDYRKSFGDYIGLAYRLGSRNPRMLSSPHCLKQIEVLLSQLYECSPHAALIAQRYFQDIGQALAEMFRVLKPGRKCVIVVGPSTLAGHSINTPALLQTLAEIVGFNLLEHHTRTLDKAKRCLPYGSGGMSGGIRRESIIVFGKP